MEHLILDKKPRNLFQEFLEIYSSLEAINSEEVSQLSKDIVRFYNGDLSARNNLRDFMKLEVQWYDSLELNTPDYSVYGHKDYLSDLWACWVVYSRQYLKAIIKTNSLDGEKSALSLFQNVNSVLDLGCGLGYTTAALNQIFQCPTYGTNLEDTIQYAFCEKLATVYDFNIITDTKELKKVDLVFASEYFEHILEPIEDLKTVLKLQPSYLIIANAFNAIATGHFNKYIVHSDGSFTDLENRIPNNKIGKLFNKELRDNGYVKIQTKLWNNRPSIWIKEN